MSVLVSVEDYNATAICESCGVAADRAFLPEGWSQCGRSRRRIFMKDQWAGDALADWCPECWDEAARFNNPSAAELHKIRTGLIRGEVGR